MAWEERADAMIGVSAAFLAFAWITFSLRAYVKAAIMRTFQWDDWFIVATILVFTIDSALLMEVGRETKRSTSARLVTVQVFQFAFYTLSNVFLKISLAITFHRILLERWQRVTIYTAVALHSAFGLGTFFLLIFRCGNPLHIYMQSLQGQCISYDSLKVVQYTNSSINTFADWLLTLVPIFALRTMKLNRQAKASAWIIFVLGCVSSAVSIPRFGFIYALGGTGEAFWMNAFHVAVLSVAEVGVGIAAACLLTLRPLIRNWRERAHTPSGPEKVLEDGDGDTEMTEYGEAKAVTIRSFSGSSLSDQSDSAIKVRSIPDPVFVTTTNVDESPVSSPAISHMRKRSSVVREEDLAYAVAAALQPEDNMHQPLTSYTAHVHSPHSKPWKKEERRMSFHNIRRLTWNDVHSQWTNLHASRAAYHGKERRTSNRLTMLFPNYDVE